MRRRTPDRSRHPPMCDGRRPCSSAHRRRSDRLVVLLRRFRTVALLHFLHTCTTGAARVRKPVGPFSVRSGRRRLSIRQDRLCLTPKFEMRRGGARRADGRGRSFWYVLDLKQALRDARPTSSVLFASGTRQRDLNGATRWPCQTCADWINGKSPRREFELA